jgi:hypothetical protein
MRLHAHQDQNQSRHLDIVGGGNHPWSIDLVTVTAAALLVAGFVAALTAELVW